MPGITNSIQSFNGDPGQSQKRGKEKLKDYIKTETKLLPSIESVKM